MNEGNGLRQIVFAMVAEGALEAEAAMALIRRARALPATPAAAAAPAAMPAAPRDIAVIGMAGRFGSAPDLDAYWRMLEAGEDCLIPMPERRWPEIAGPRRRGGFLPDEDMFDPLFFRISPNEAALMDPQQRLFLETAWHALEDAGYAEPALSGARCGVFVGAGAGDYAQRLRAAGLDTSPLGLMGNVASILAARISYLLNLKGPSIALDTACSSSLVAVHLACESLLAGTCDMALAGGVAVISTPDFLTAMTAAGMLSPQDRCASFGAGADGFVCGEGAGAVVLKRLADAERDGDAIIGVIRGSGINQDGRTNGITAPSAPSQAALEAEVHARAGIDPATISYVEAHGTGTALGDPIEVEALTAAFRRHTDRTGFCALGSAKANIGHLLTAAGIAGLIKLLLMLRHRRIPPLAGFSEPNPRIDFAATPFTLPSAAREWTAPGTLRAAVSSFGFSGTNAHVVVEGPPPAPARPPASARPRLFLLSARSPEALRARAEALTAHLARGAVDARDLAFTLAAGREHFAHRLAVVASGGEALRARLQDWLAGRAHEDLLAAEARPGGPGPALAAFGARLLQEAGATADAAALRALADLYTQGAGFDLARLPGCADGRRIHLPLYPFERIRCPPPAPEPAGALPAVAPAPVVPAPVALAAGAPDPDPFDGLAARLAALPDVAPDLDARVRAFRRVEAWGRRGLRLAYARLGLSGGERRVFTVAGLRRALGIVAAKERLHDALIDILVREEALSREGDVLRLRQTIDEAALRGELAAERARLTAEDAELAPFLALLARCLDCLPAVLTGALTPTEALFPDGRMDLVEPIYQGNRLAGHFNALIAAAAAHAARGGRPRLLEIGAGTGGATAGILAALEGSSFDYHYTDVSQGFVQFGRQRFGRPGMAFATLDITREPAAQGFAPGGFDIVIASNVLHAAPRIGEALSHAASLLRPGGVLLLNEVTALQDFATLTFGLTDGWWAFEDAPARIQGAPLLDIPGWRRALAEAGFARMEPFGLPGETDRERLGQSVIVARRAGAAAAAMPAAPAPDAPAAGDLAALVAGEVARALGLPVERLDRRARFMDFGVDSILGGQLIAGLNAALGIDLRPTVVFDHPSVEDLARHIARAHAPRLPAASRAAPAAPPAPVPAKIAEPAGEDRRIAVIGMAARFADCPDLASFREMLATGRSGITEVPADRWSADPAALPPDVAAEARFLRWGGFLRDAGLFDPLFFRISGREAELTDPQHRVFLTEAWRALEDAGYGERELDGRRCGVFVGAYGGDYTHRMTELGIAPEAFAFMGNAAAILAGRISYVLNLKGPNLAVDTACSSSLSALHLACRALLAGECDMALAGGVFLTTTMGFNTAAAKAGMLSPTGACHTFDAAADGFVPGEGAGVVILKPYARAVADGDHIEAVILASAMNQDGKTNGITAPSPESQAALESEVYEIAGISPEAIGYVEAHGTGTQLGDPIEIEGLTRAFRRHTDRAGFCAIGSVKTNIGHAAHAAGIAGFIKTVLSVRDGVLFPSINFRAENPQLRLAETPFRVNTALRRWEGPRLAAVSSFGFSGTNVHVLVAEPPAPPARALPEGPQLVALSARNPAALARQIAALAGWLATNEAPLIDIARTLNGGRCHFDARWAVVADSLPALAAALARGMEAPVDACAQGPAANGASARHAALIAAAGAFRRGEDLPAVAVPAEGRRISLPTYPFEMRRYWLDAPPAVARPAAAERAALFAPDWQPAPAAPASMPGRVWLVAEDEGAGLAARWRAAGVAVTLLSPAQAAGAAALRRDGVPDAVVLLDLAPPGAPSADGGRMIAPLFHLLRAFAGDPVRVLAVHRGGAEMSAALALRRSLAFGGAPVDLRTLELEAMPEAGELAARIAAELAAPAGTGAARLRGGARLVRRMAPLAPARGFALPSGGHFLITGGGGVLAALFARRLAAATGGSVSLVGRGEPGAAARAALADLGDRAAWFRADVTDLAGLAAAVAAARARFGRVRGAIHAAGVPAELPLADSDWPRFAACLAPKMAGAVGLDAALAADAPDFLVLFSSLAAELGDFGQGCYALGNAFCDRFAAWRAGARPGRTVSIGWPLWREGRGVLSPEGEKVYLATAGIPYLETETGWQAFLDALAADAPQVAVVPGTPERAAALFAPPVDAAPRAAAAAAPAPSAVAAPAPDLRPQVLARLTDIVASLLKIDRDLLDPATGLADFGFDSIALKDFARLISESWGVSVSPAVFFARGTLGALAEYLVTEHGAALAAPAAPEPVAPVAMPVPEPVPVAVPAGVEPVAIIGMAGQFPGSPDLDSFWRNLAGERELVGPLPAGRTLAPAPERGVDPARLRAGFLERVDAFDAAFFRISPREACFLDPQHRLAIEAVWHAVEDAGIRMGALAGRPVGVFFGPQVNEYGAMVPDRGAARAQVALGNIATMLPNRISYLFDLRGPSEAIDTACSSSLVAVHRAVRALQAGECEMALAGGVSLVLSEESIVSTAELGVVSPDGRCHSFDARANGYVKGEGVGVVLLKPLARALAEGDPVQAVILGSAENHGGHAHSLTAPNGTAQAALIAAALRRAGVASDTVSYIEAHGTGTELGDPVEVMALKEAFAATAAPGSVAAPRCGLGTVKTNIGHLEPASGIAGLIKTVLALRHATLPASLNFERANPLIDFAGTPFEVVARTRPWARPRDAAGGELPRRAGVSSFGLGGSNAHVVLQEAPVRAAADVTEAPVLLTVSARDRGRLTVLLERLRDFAAADPALRPADVAHTLQAGREAMAERAAILLRPGQALADGFAAALRAIGGAPVAEVWLGTARAQIGGEGPDATLPPLAQAAAAWADGADLPAAALARGRRVRLPGYPFARTPFWFDQAPPRAATPPALPVAPPVAPPEPPPVAAPAPVAVPAARTDAGGLRAVIRRHLARALYLDEAQLDDHAGFADLGLDSILAVELAKSLNDELGTALQATRLYDHATIAGLADWLAAAPAAVAADDPALRPVLDVLTAELAARGHAGLGGASRLDAIGLAPADGKAMLAAMNARFGTALSEADVAGCETLAALAARFAAPAPVAASVAAPVAEPEAAPVPATPDIAIIGYACRLPGAPDADAFWRLLEGDAPAITELPPEPWRAGIYRAGLGDAAAWGGYIGGADRFDAGFFNIRPEQARLMDPLQRLFLETAWHALEAAGQTRARLDGAACGVFVGGGPSDYAKLLENDPAALDGGTLLGNTGSVMAARIAYFLNLRGPCLAIDTACSSGLVALHAAWQAIRDGQCDMALVGGVNLLVTPQMHAMTGRAGMLAADGRCKSFDDSADGFVPAEGVVALVLKRLDRARADGDPVHALVRGVGVNQNGTTAGITAPSARAQARLLDALYRRAGIAPGEIGLVEAHGTGTKIGDALEFDALREAFAGVAPGAVALGSAKPLIGHAFAASGLASVVKLLLALAHRRIPPTRGLGRVNAHMRLAGSPFRINTAAEDWPAPPGGQRHAAATAYGLSGTNAHVVLAEPPAAPAPARNQRATHLFVLSGTDAAALGRQVAALAAWLATARPEPADLAYTLALRRTHLASRAAFAAGSLAELRAQLAAWPAAAPVADPALAETARRFCAGEAVDFTALYPTGQVCAAPGYVFAAERYWPDAPVAAPQPAGAAGGLDARLRAVIAAALEVPAERIAPDLPFDALGLTSLNALELIRRAEAEFGVALPAIAVWDNPTPARLAAFIAAQPPAQPVRLASVTGADGSYDPLVTIRAEGSRVPSFWVHGGPGDVNWVMELARRLPADMPVYAFEARGLGSDAPPPDSVEAMARDYVARLTEAWPAGPIVLGGYSAGGAIAFEMARQLEQAGRPAARLLLLDANAPGNDAVAAIQEGFGPGYVHLVAGNWLGARWGAGRPLRLDELDGLDGPAALEAVLAYLFAEARPDVEEATARRWLEALDRVGWSIGAALRAYRPAPLACPVEAVLIACTRGMAGGANPLGLPDLPAARAYRDGWETLLPSPPRIVARDCDHFALLRGADAAWLGETLAALPDPGAGPGDAARARVTALVLDLVRRMLPDVPAEAVVPERAMSELGATSMDRVEVATLAMEALGIVVPNRELAGAGTIGGLIDILCRHGVYA